MSNTCKGCGRPVKWIKTTQGKSMIADPEEVTIITRGGSIYKGFIVHWSTCPESDQFKKKPTTGLDSMQWQCPICKEYLVKGHGCRTCGTTESTRTL